MGDRATFIVVQPNGYLAIYGHWAGNGMLGNLASAIDRVLIAGRATDYEYGTRIIVSSLMDDGVLGWGLSVNRMTDTEHSVPVVNFNTGTVSLYDKYFSMDNMDSPKFTMGFQQFVKRFG